MKTLFKTYDIIQAQFLQQALTEADIPCTVTGITDLGMGQAQEIEIRVPEEHLEGANEIKKIILS